MKFKDRADAGKKLAAVLEKFRGNKEVIVLGLPRGGVIPAFEVARGLGLDLDIIVTRKIGAPIQPELAVGALTQDGVPIFSVDLMEQLGLSEEDLQNIISDEQKEGQRRLAKYRANKKSLELKDRIALLVDDGIATGATMRAAIKSARDLGAKKVIVAVPVAPADTLAKIKQQADEVICLYTPEPFFGVGGFYERFAQTEDEEVIDLLSRSGE